MYRRGMSLFRPFVAIVLLSAVFISLRRLLVVTETAPLEHSQSAYGGVPQPVSFKVKPASHREEPVRSADRGVVEEIDVKPNLWKEYLEKRIKTAVKKTGCPGCFQLNFKWLTTPERSLCTTSAKPKLLILVSSKHHHQAYRDAIRTSWGSVLTTDHPVRMVFVMGRDDRVSAEDEGRLNSESIRHHDILRGDFKETSEHATLKLLAGFRWAVQFCSAVPFIMKVKDNVFINVKGLVSLLESHEEQLRDKLFGSCSDETVKKVKVRLNTTNKKHINGLKVINSTEAPHKRCLEPAFGVSMKIVQKTLAASRKMSVTGYYGINDGAFMGVAMQILGHRTCDLAGFYLTKRDPFVEQYVTSLLKTPGVCPETGRAKWSFYVVHLHKQPPEVTSLLWKNKECFNLTQSLPSVPCFCGKVGNLAKCNRVQKQAVDGVSLYRTAGQLQTRLKNR